MAAGQVDPAFIPDDGLTTRKRHVLSVTAVPTGPGKGKPTAAFGMALRAWNQGIDSNVCQFIRPGNCKVGEQAVLIRLGEPHTPTCDGGAVESHIMGAGWPWSKKQGTAEDHARDADPRIIQVADLVTEMTKIKHPMEFGRTGQKGIEW